MAPARIHTNVPGHIGNICLDGFRFLPDMLGRLIPQVPVVVQSIEFLPLSDIISSPYSTSPSHDNIPPDMLITLKPWLSKNLVA
jgi:hypothetical protein